MKKTRLFISLILVVTLCFTMGAAFGYGETYTKENAPEITLGENMTIDVKEMKESQEETMDLFVCKFTPEEDGCYMVTFDTPFDPAPKSEYEPAVIMAGFLTEKDLDSENEEDLTEGGIVCISSKGLSDEDRAMFEEMGLIAIGDPSFTQELKKGTAYYLFVGLTGSESYTSNIVISTHTHALKTVRERAGYEKEDGTTYYYSGGKYEECTLDHCYYINELEYYPAVDSIKLSQTSYVYNTKAKEPTVTIKDIEGGKLKKGTDYTVKYENNVKVGKGKVIIQFKGNYKGKITKTFKINPPKIAISGASRSASKKIKVSWKKAKYTSQVTGYQIKYSLKSSFKNSKTVTVSGAKKTSRVIKNLKAGKKYYFKVRAYKIVNSKMYVSAWSKVKSAKA